MTGGSGGGHGGSGGRGYGQYSVGQGDDSLYTPVGYGNPGGYGKYKGKYTHLDLGNMCLVTPNWCFIVLSYVTHTFVKLCCFASYSPVFKRFDLHWISAMEKVCIWLELLFL